jgi:F0F1-type ATP synthase beta subunit
MTQSTQPGGKVLAIRGAVVDVAFEGGELPRLEEALSNGISRERSSSRFRHISTKAL